MLNFDYLIPQFDLLSKRSRRKNLREQHLQFREWLERRYQGFYSNFGNIPGTG